MISRAAITKARRGLALAVLLAAPLLAATLVPRTASSQSGVPGLPPGTAVLRGVVESPSGPAAQIEVALYALTPSGHPGLGHTTTDQAGRFAFEKLSNDPEIAYLLGARYADVPFSRRVGFSAGQTELELRIEVTNPVPDTSPVQVSSTLMRFDWAGSQLAIGVTQVLRNPTEDILFVAASKRQAARPLRVATLPAGASDFRRLPGGGGDELELIGGEVGYWGPFFPGEQELTYQYLLPATPGEQVIEAGFPAGTGMLAVAYPETGPSVAAPSLEAADAVEIDRVSYASLTGGAIAAGGKVAFSLSLPELRMEPEALTFQRSEMFLELDDASLTVNQEIMLEVQPGPPLAAAPGEVLLKLELPLGSQLIGMSPEAAAIGVSTSGSTILIAGPLAPGSTRLGFRYAIATENDGVSLDLRFPLTLETLRINIADTGDLVVSSNRLHRLRPAPSGTRTYLRREAFHVVPGERVSLEIARPIQPALPRTATMGLMLVAGALACVFLIRPLRREAQEILEEDVEARVSHERSLVYASIHDLDHDFETGKVSEADYHTMRATLRQSAVDLLRHERQPQAPVQEIRRAEAPDADPAPGAAATGRFCPACGGQVDPAWRFCSHCGGGLSPQKSAGTGSGG